MNTTIPIKRGNHLKKKWLLRSPRCSWGSNKHPRMPKVLPGNFLLLSRSRVRQDRNRRMFLLRCCPVLIPTDFRSTTKRALSRISMGKAQQWSQSICFRPCRANTRKRTIRQSSEQAWNRTLKVYNLSMLHIIVLQQAGFRCQATFPNCSRSVTWSRIESEARNRLVSGTTRRAGIADCWKVQRSRFLYSKGRMNRV